MDFKTRLVELRHDSGLSQSKLAEKTGLSYSIIQKWEIGEREPTGYSLIVLSKFFGVPTDYLLGLVD
ncbi:hypothetical protein FACS1894211_12060 [Clostridia bacterium]|nr:hypothetical protein FACS1894211_12060 [Clostridia bacterium]